MTTRAAGELLARLEPLGIRLDLADFRRLLAACGSPERRLATVVVGGTNGKGTVSALLDSMARSAGLRVGLYTSPHLERWEERIRIDGSEIPAADLGDRLDDVVRAAAQAELPLPTVFEALTAAALLHFVERPVDLAVLEVGMGGRLDATNVTNPLVTVVTRIALDHREWLGDDLAAIAREKAGIFRREVAAVVAQQEGEAGGALAAAADDAGAPLRRVTDEVVDLEAEWRGLAGHRVTLRTRRRDYRFELPLAGEHQIGNLATAVVAGEILGERFPELDRAAMERGVAAVRWPARLERIPLLRPPLDVLLDAAHNPDGCAALLRFLDRLGRSYVLLFGALADKDVEAMLPPLAAAAVGVVLTRPESARAREPESLLGFLRAGATASVEPTAAAALAAALRIAASGGVDLVVACGSIVVAGAIRRELGRLGAHAASEARGSSAEFP